MSLSFLSSPRNLDVLIIHIWFTIYSLVLPRLPGPQVRPYPFYSVLHTRVGLVKPVSLSLLSILRRPLDLFTSSHVSRLRTPRHHRSLVPRPTSYTSTIPQDHARYNYPAREDLYQMALMLNYVCPLVDMSGFPTKW